MSKNNKPGHQSEISIANAVSNKSNDGKASRIDLQHNDVWKLTGNSQFANLQINFDKQLY